MAENVGVSIINKPKILQQPNIDIVKQNKFNYKYAFNVSLQS